MEKTATTRPSEIATLLKRKIDDKIRSFYRDSENALLITYAPVYMVMFIQPKELPDVVYNVDSSGLV